MHESNGTGSFSVDLSNRLKQSVSWPADSTYGSIAATPNATGTPSALNEHQPDRLWATLAHPSDKRRRIMATLTLSTRTPEAIGRGQWTSCDSYEVFRFLVQSCGIVCVGVFLYSLGPALGIAALACGLVAWSMITNFVADKKEQTPADEGGEHDEPTADAGVPSRCLDTARLKNDPLGVSTAMVLHPARRPVLRQGA